MRPSVRYSLDVSPRPADALRHACISNVSNLGAVWGTSPDWLAVCREQTPRNQDRGSSACLDPPCLLSNLPDLTKFLSWRLARGHQRKTPPQVGPARGFQRAVRLGGLTPGLRTERRGQDDTPKRKMMRARLPSIAKGLIQFECGTDTTVGAIPGPQSTATHQTGFQG